MTYTERLLDRRSRPPKWTYFTLSAVATLIWLSYSGPWYGSRIKAAVDCLLGAALMWFVFLWPAVILVTLGYALRIGMRYPQP